ncbi:histidine kinase N-terminal 7TM domain-containing protein [Halovenus rubra]|uniref:histidine kinase n=2 Tax=Halovenus rubra TaxID=869890 RepID=A0ABD5XCG5_9EURY|nr:histidine kinase N-terminal 7TM domain-containing protein [Halovenus rubra]
MSTAAQSMSMLMLVSAAPLVGLAAYASLNLEKPGARGFLLCQIGALGWAIQLAALTWPTRLMPVHLNTAGRMLFQFLVVFGWPLLVWEYTRSRRVQPRKSVVALLLVFPVVTLGLAVTNPDHHLVLATGTPTNPAGIGAFELGPWYLLFILFTVSLVIPPAVILANDMLSADGAHRNQLTLLLGGWVIGFPGTLQTYIFRNIDAVPMYVDLTPLAFSVSAVLWGVALFRYHLLGLVPVSRHTTVETMADPVIAVDGNRTVVDVNPAARRLFRTEGTDVAGISLESFCRDFPSLLTAVEPGERCSEEVTLDTETGPRHFSLNVRPISRGQTTSGSVFVFREVTELRERERELELLKQIHSRVLRHNIRNQLTILKGHIVEIERQENNSSVAEHTSEINKTADTLLEHSEKATDLRDIIDSDTQPAPGSLTSVVKGEIKSLTREYPAVDVDAAFEDDVSVRAHIDIHRAIRELLDNAVVHNERALDEIRLRVRVSTTAKQGVLTIEDNGPGINDTEVATLEAGEETALQHVSGIGLWMVRMLVDKSGGTLLFSHDTELGGTRVKVRLPLAEDDGKEEL